MTISSITAEHEECLSTFSTLVYVTSTDPIGAIHTRSPAVQALTLRFGLVWVTDATQLVVYVRRLGVLDLNTPVDRGQETHGGLWEQILT